MDRIRIEVASRWRTKSEERDLPTSFNELSESQFRSLMRHHGAIDSNPYFLAEFYNLNVKFINKMSSYQRFMLEYGPRCLLVKELIANHFFIQSLFRCFIAPSPKLTGVTLRHFVFFDTFFFQATEKQDKESKARFIAALYLKRGETITAFDFDKRVDLFLSLLDDSVAEAVMFNYVCIRHWLAKAFPLVFSFSKKKDEDKKAQQPDWRAIVDNFAAADILHLDEYYEIPVTDFFRIMNKRLAEYNRQKEEMNKIRTKHR